MHDPRPTSHNPRRQHPTGGRGLQLGDAHTPTILEHMYEYKRLDERVSRPVQHAESGAEAHDLVAVTHRPRLARRSAVWALGGARDPAVLARELRVGPTLAP